MTENKQRKKTKNTEKEAEWEEKMEEVHFLPT